LVPGRGEERRGEERRGVLPTEKVPLRAAYWIAAGHDGEALIYLAGLHGDDPREDHDQPGR
jgi:hypothetical protein